MRRKAIVITASLFFASCLALCAQTARRRGPIVRQVDHIMIESANPKALFIFFTEALNLPTAWPIESRQGYTSGGVGAGNVTLEIFQYERKDENPGKNQARFSGFVFEPHPLSKALQEMQVSGIPFTSLEPQYSTLPNGSTGVALTRVALPSFSNSEFSVFLYEYSQEFLNVDVRRKQLGNRLVLNNGGPLGLQSVSEIIITVANLEKKQQAWMQLLGKPKSAGFWLVGTGPAIRLVQGRGAEDHIREIVMEVKSLYETRSFLRKEKMLSPDGAFLNPVKVQQLRISLVDSSKIGQSVTQ
jgi:hypothetical protein